MLGSDDSLQDGLAQPLANGRWKIEGEGWEVKREEKVGLGIWDRACYHCRSGRDLRSASRDSEVDGIVLIVGTRGKFCLVPDRGVLMEKDSGLTAGRVYE
jgi:hypothetical protein